MKWFGKRNSVCSERWCLFYVLPWFLEVITKLVKIYYSRKFLFRSVGFIVHMVHARRANCERVRIRFQVWPMECALFRFLSRLFHRAITALKRMNYARDSGYSPLAFVKWTQRMWAYVVWIARLLEANVINILKFLMQTILIEPQLSCIRAHGVQVHTFAFSVSIATHTHAHSGSFYSNYR